MTDFGQNDAPYKPMVPRAPAETWGRMDPSYQEGGVFPAINTGINWLGTQFTKGITGMVGAPRAVGEMNQRLAEWGGEKLGIPEAGRAVGQVLRHAVPGFGITPSAEELNTAIFTNVAPEVNAGDVPGFTVGGVNLGKVADAAAQTIPAAAVGLGAVLPNALGATTSELSGQATEGTPYEIPARIVGAVPGAMAGTWLTTPLPANLTPQQARAVELAKNPPPGLPRVPLSVGQETGRGVGVERFFSRMPGGQGISEKFAARQGAATDEMALAQAGFKGNETGQETMKALAKQAGAEFEAAKKMPGSVDLAPTFPKVRQAVAEYEGVMDPAKRSPVVATEAGRFLSKEAQPASYPPLPAAEAVSRTPSLANLKTAIGNASKSVDEAFDKLPVNFSSWFNKGPMVPMPKELPELSNQQYQTLRKELTDSLNAIYKGGIGKDTNAAEALKAMRNALDDAAEASLGSDKLAAWKQARQHYAAFKTIEKAMNSGTTAARSEGTLGANALTGALKRVQGDKFYETTGGLNDVATIKGYLRDTFPNSGTPTTLAQGAAAGTLGLSMIPPWIGQRIMTGAPGTGWVRNYLANQAMPDTIPSGLRALPPAAIPGFAVEATTYPRLEFRQ